MRSHQRAHPRSRRPATLLPGAVALATALLATGCDGTSATASAGTDGTVFETVRFTLDSRGDIRLSGNSRAAVRPAGSHPVSGGRAHPFTRPAGSLLVVLRHWPDTGAGADRASRGRAPRMWPPEEPAVETGYLVDTADWVRADLDGHPLQWLRRDALRIDVTNTAAGDLARLTLSGPHGGRSGQPTPPPDDRACAHLDPWVGRHVVLPPFEAGTPVGTALTRLRKLCLDVQYSSLPGAERGGTVRQVLVPLAGPRGPAAALPPLDSAAVPGREPGDLVLVDPSRPATLAVTRGNHSPAPALPRRSPVRLDRVRP
ncbi:hypothetical protein ACIO93_19730 [Streptomyces sp. NPDC087903]|uniref:hypothetical protein n=1 Tax=Streptomyces sp. NPDC087903 TaxID=3365819 RepID=UPI003815B511